LDGDSGQQQSIAATVQEISERSTKLIREEIELAKAEVQQKFNQLIRGVVIGTVAGIFIGTALLFVLHGAAWLAWFELFGPGEFFWGFFLVAGVLLVLGGLAGWLAAKLFRSGAPPTPDLAVEEAKRIRETVEGSASGGRLEPTPVGGEHLGETQVGGGEV
jgi:tetrahydromethanopterin S-methyltransferase subunit G